VIAQFIRRRVEPGALHFFGAAGLLLIAMALTKEEIVMGTVSMVSVGSYGQLAYWLLIAMTAASICETRRDMTILLYGLAAGGVATAISIVAGYFFGGLNPYEGENVTASAGWFHTAKTITGVLVTAVIVTLYLGQKTRGWLSAALAGLCCLACVMTYARAGAVALLLVILWFGFWWLRFGRIAGRRWLTKFLLFVAIAAAFLPVLMHSESWQSRWEDLHTSDNAGSGRATFWRIALNAYANGDNGEHLFGMGYAAMADMLLDNYGDDIRHTHNDFLDALLVSGIVGVVWLLSWLGYLLLKTVSISLTSREGAAAAAVLIAYLCHAQFTGQLFGTDSMTYYVIALACFYQIAGTRDGKLQKAMFS
jgi:O-antigen ligase